MTDLKGGGVCTFPTGTRICTLFKPVRTVGVLNVISQCDFVCEDSQSRGDKGN